jgi:hypothetical protein
LDEASVAARESVENQPADEVMSNRPLPAVRQGTGDDYYSVLARVIAVLTQDHEQLRAMVYELARQKLREELTQQIESVGRWGMQIRSLEAAIVRFESDCVKAAISKEPPHLQAGQVVPGAEAEPEYHSQRLTTGLVRRWSAPSAISVLEYEPPIRYRYLTGVPLGARSQSYPQALPRPVEVMPAGRKKVLWRGLFSTLQLVFAAAIGVALYTFADNRFSELFQLQRWKTGITSATNNEAAAHARVSELQRATAMARGAGSGTTSGHADKSTGPPSNRMLTLSRPDFPMPNSYGAYAVVDGKLIDMDIFPIKVPDARVAISGMFSQPSEVRIPAGPLQFVIFRRDLTNNAPDHVELRIVARVERALTFSPGGKAVVANVKDGWIVRGDSYQLKVSPVPESSEMIVLRSDNPQTILPSGRYALVVKNIAYDLTIDGNSSDGAHCLERTEALGAPVYTVCRKP